MKYKFFKSFFFLSLSLFFFVLFTKQSYAASCASVPISGNYTVTANCTFANAVDGVDAGTGTTNTAVLTVNTGQTLTVGTTTQTIAYGSITLQSGSAIIITKGTGSSMVKGPLWMTDQDADGYPASTTQISQATQPANGRRRNLETTIAAADCLDTDATKYQNLTGYNDLDGDTYTSGTTQICSGASLPTYNQTTSPYRSAASGTADCYDVNSTGGTNAHPLQSGWFTANRGDGSNDYNCDGTGVSLANIAILAWVNSSCNSVATNSSSNYWIRSTPFNCPTGLTAATQGGYDPAGSTITCNSFTYKSAVGGTTTNNVCKNLSGGILYN